MERGPEIAGRWQAVSTYRIVFERRAEKEMDSLPVHVQRRFHRALAELSRDPFRNRPGCDVRRLGGEPGAFAIRVGAYRGMFEIEGETIRFSSFAHRSVAYR